MITRAKVVCAVAASGFVMLTAAMPAQALTMKECSAKYKAAQTAGTLKGVKWNDFRKAECGADAAATTPAAAPAATPTPAPGGGPTPNAARRGGRAESGSSAHGAAGARRQRRVSQRGVGKIFERV